jgi:predicted regulator of Ras-like GTPase activity (Roadblock/LC7/MglB family)
MAFLPHLESVVTQVDGAIACSVMGFDGIAVETYQAPSAADAASALDITSAWIEYGNTLSQLKSGAELLKAGAVAEVSINTDRLITLMRMVTPEYFVVLGLKPEGNYGKGRYVLRVTAPKLKAEL